MLDAASGSVSIVTAEKRYQACLEQQYRLAWTLVDRHYMRRDRLRSWEWWEHRYDGKLSCAADLEGAVTQMVQSLGDEYTYVRSKNLTCARKIQEEEHNTVSHRVLRENIGYLKINSFLSRHVADETAEALGRLTHVRGLIVDLRGNVGGGVDEALAVFSLLSEKGRIASFKGWFDGGGFTEDVELSDRALVSTDNGSLIQSPRRPWLFRKKPIVVLVDEDTRSAAELLAGALHDTRGARIVGTRTFGKGLVQKTWDLPSGISLKLVIARYYLPSGSCIDGVGLKPDYKASGDRQVGRALRLFGKGNSS